MVLSTAVVLVRGCLAHLMVGLFGVGFLELHRALVQRVEVVVAVLQTASSAFGLLFCRRPTVGLFCWLAVVFAALWSAFSSFGCIGPRSAIWVRLRLWCFFGAGTGRRASSARVVGYPFVLAQTDGSASGVRAVRHLLVLLLAVLCVLPLPVLGPSHWTRAAC